LRGFSFTGAKVVHVGRKTKLIFRF